MPQRAEEIRRAHLSDVAEALRLYIEAGHDVSLETAFIAEDQGTITLGLDLSAFHPLLRTLSEWRFGVTDATPEGVGQQSGSPGD